MVHEPGEVVVIPLQPDARQSGHQLVVPHRGGRCGSCCCCCIPASVHECVRMLVGNANDDSCTSQQCKHDHLCQLSRHNTWRNKHKTEKQLHMHILPWSCFTSVHLAVLAGVRIHRLHPRCMSTLDSASALHSHMQSTVRLGGARSSICMG